MTQFLPPNLLALFAPRDSIPYKAPVGQLTWEKDRTKSPYIGIGHLVSLFEDPKDTPPPTRGEIKAEKKKRRIREKAEKRVYEIQDEESAWDPHNDPNANSDAFKTLFVSRINYDTSESKLRREFEMYGKIKKIHMVKNVATGKSRGYAFIEYEKERDMHAAYKSADGKKIDGRRVLVDVERGRTVKGWKPRRLGGGLGSTRAAVEDGDRVSLDRERNNSSTRDLDRERARPPDRAAPRERERDRSDRRDRRDRDKGDHDRDGGDRDRDRGDRDRDRGDRDRDRGDRDRDRNRDRPRERDRDRGDRDKRRRDNRDRRDRDKDRDKDRDRKRDDNKSSRNRDGATDGSGDAKREDRNRDRDGESRHRHRDRSRDKDRHERRRDRDQDRDRDRSGRDRDAKPESGYEDGKSDHNMKPDDADQSASHDDAPKKNESYEGNFYPQQGGDESHSYENNGYYEENNKGDFKQENMDYQTQDSASEQTFDQSKFQSVTTEEF